MRSDIRKRLGRSLAGVAAIVTAAALSPVFAGGTAAAEDSPAPAPLISAEVQIQSPSPSANAVDGGVAISELVADPNDASKFSGTITVTLTGGLTTAQLNVHATNGSVVITPALDLWVCVPGAEQTNCTGSNLTGETHTFAFTGQVNNPKPGHKATVKANVSVEGDSNADNNNAEAEYTIPASYGAVVSGYVWNDTNKNGQQDSGENGISGVRVQAFDGEQQLKETTTDGSGRYSLAGIVGANVDVTVAGPSDLVFTAQDQGSDLTDSDVNANGLIKLGQVGDKTTFTVDAGLHSTGGGGGDPTTTPPPGTTTPPPGTTDPTTDPTTGGPTRSGTPSPTTTRPGVNNPATTAPKTPSPTLPKTGSDTGSGPIVGTLAAGAVMMAAGGALAVAARRRKEAAEGLAS